jgi:hypothetical protein
MDLQPGLETALDGDALRRGRGRPPFFVGHAISGGDGGVTPWGPFAGASAARHGASAGFRAAKRKRT